MYIVWGCAEISPATFLASTSIEWTNLHISRFRLRYCFVVLIPGSYLLCKAFVYFGQSFAENSYVILNLWFFFFLVEYLFLEFVSFCAKVLYAYPKTKQWKMKKLHTLTELINNRRMKLRMASLSCFLTLTQTNSLRPNTHILPVRYCMFAKLHLAATSPPKWSYKARSISWQT